MRKISSKDLAFEKERANYRKQIREKEAVIAAKNQEIEDLKVKLEEKKMKSE